MAFLRQEARVVERFRIIEVAETESVTEAARRFDCSRTTVYKLIARHREGGLIALVISALANAHLRSASANSE